MSYLNPALGVGLNPYTLKIPTIKLTPNLKKLLVLSILLLYLGLGFILGASHQAKINNLGLENVKTIGISASNPTYTEVILQSGESLELTSTDGKTHSLIFIDPETIEVKGIKETVANIVKPNEKYRMVFEKPGLYKLQDSSNPENFITVYVVEPQGQII